MAKYQFTGPDGGTYQIDAPDSVPQGDVMDFVHQKFTADPKTPAPEATDKPPELPSVYSQFPSELSGKGALAATLGASDTQLGDIAQKALGDKFLRRETLNSAAGPKQGFKPRGNATPDRPAQSYDVFVTRGPNGEEQRGYLNKPGLDAEDLVRGGLGALPFVAGGGLAAGIGERLGLGLLGRMGVFGGTNAAISAGGDLAQKPLGSDQGVETGKAVANGLFGLGTPLASRLAGATTGAIAERTTPLPIELQPYSRRATNQVLRAATEDSLAGPNAHAVGNANLRRQAIGPEGTLAQMGENLQLHSEGIANTPGAGRTIVRNTLEGRAEGAPQRLLNETNRVLGVPQDIPAYLRTEKARFNQQAAPYYDQFHNTSIPVTPEIRQVLDSIPAAAFNRAQTLARAEGYRQQFRLRPVDNAMTPMTGARSMTREQVPTGLEYDYLKRAVDDLARNAEPGSNAQRIYGHLARNLRNTIDETLSPGAPNQSPWAVARGIAGDGPQGREGVQVGQRVFSGKMRPYDLNEELRNSSAYRRRAIEIGARDDLATMFGRNATNFGPRGDTALRRGLNSEFNRQNLNTIVGPQRAQRLLDRVNYENEAADNLNQTIHGSPTGRRNEIIKQYSPVNVDPINVRNATLTGLATEGVLRGANLALRNGINRARERFGEDVADMLMSQGAARDDILRALRNYGAARANRRSAADVQMERIVQTLLQTNQRPAIQYYQGQP
jgi:hypothetical protein